MIDLEFTVTRYISVFSVKAELIVARHDLDSFNLIKFQEEFGESDVDNPMFDSYKLMEINLSFISLCLENEPAWNFCKYRYFLECDRLE